MTKSESTLNFQNINLRELLRDMGVPVSGGNSNSMKCEPSYHHYKGGAYKGRKTSGAPQPAYGFTMEQPLKNSLDKTMDGVPDWNCSSSKLGDNCVPTSIGGKRSRKGKKGGNRKTRGRGKKLRGGDSTPAASMGCSQCGTNDECSCGAVSRFGFDGKLGEGMLASIPKYSCTSCFKGGKSKKGKGKKGKKVKKGKGSKKK